MEYYNERIYIVHIACLKKDSYASERAQNGRDPADAGGRRARRAARLAAGDRPRARRGHGAAAAAGAGRARAGGCRRDVVEDATSRVGSRAAAASSVAEAGAMRSSQAEPCWAAAWHCQSCSRFALG